MTSTVRFVGQPLLWLYNLLLLGWWLLHLVVGDSWWWMGLLNSFVPLFFAPLLLLIPLALVIRRPLYLCGLLLPLTFLLANYGFYWLPKPQPPHAPVPPPLTIMTFNMWSGSRLPETVQVIHDNGLPDIVALQETDYLLRRLVQREIGDLYPYQLYEQTPIGRGISILSRFPLTPLRPEAMIVDLNCRLYRVTVDATHPVLLYNCHPQSSNLLAFFGDGRPMADQIGETFFLRQQLSLALAAEIRTASEPVIVVGDFNMTDQSDAYSNLARVLHDAHRNAGWGFGHTFPAYGGSFRNIPILPRLVRIDMIFYSDAFVALESHVSDSHGESDHLPVLAALAWRE
ncbi:MAG: endonuclease/exonuclease/phosphatase family protein [Caldilineaceae bacterium]|nr:endonuclease/exonuclease/phosphatase family protein [Caldilineaceae bacterium]